MITRQDLCKGYDFDELSKDIQVNLDTLQIRINNIMTLWGQDFVVTSGFRSMEDHLRIYADKGITDQSKIPTHSKHLYGQAVDIEDKDGSLATWCHENDGQHVIDCELWCEATESTTGWVHFQIIPPGSGHRFFIP